MGGCRLPIGVGLWEGYRLHGVIHSLSRVVVPATLHTPLSTHILQDFCNI